MKNAFGKLTVKAAGVTFDNRPGKLWNIRKYMCTGAPITTMLRREPGNERDPHAIAVLVKTDTTVAKIGYVPANIAFWLSQKMDNGLSVRAYHGYVTGGAGKAKNLGFTFEIVHEIPAVATLPATD